MELFIDPGDHRSLTCSSTTSSGRRSPTGGCRPARGCSPAGRSPRSSAIARSTVTDAYARLTAEGFVEGRRGGGSIVTGGACVEPSPAATPTALTPRPEAAAIRRYGSDLTTPARYDLTAGRVDARLFPLADWRRCTNRALAGLGDQYGSYGDPTGSPELRQALARWVAQSRGVAATPEQVVVTHGAAHAVDLLARVLLPPGEVAAVEEPGYPPVANLLRTLGIQVVGVPVDEHGLVVDALPGNARLVHVTPSHQYPLGVVLSRERRLALLRWAGRHGAAIVEDDYDSEFRHTARPLEPLHRLDRDGRVIYVGTFSKILSPALRTGFAVVPTGLVPAVTAVRESVDVAPSPFITAALTTFIDAGHLGRHLRRGRRVYAERHRAVWSALTRHAGPRFTPLPAQAGLHLALLTPGAPDDDELAARAARRQLRLSRLRLSYQFSEPRAGIVVGFGAIATQDVPRAISLLRECLD